MEQNQNDNSQQPAGAQPAAAHQAAPQARPCPQDCRLCGVNQQIFCTTKMLFALSRTAQDFGQRMSMLELAMDDIKEQLQPKDDKEQLSVPFAE